MRKPYRGGNSRGGNSGGSGDNRFKNEVLVRSMPFKASEADIEDHFSQFGQINSVNLLKNPEGQSKGLCFIRFEDVASMQQAIDSSGSEFMGRNIVVEKTKPREERESGSFGNRGDDRRDSRGGRDKFGGRNEYGRGDSRGGRDRRDRDGSRDRSREREKTNDRSSHGGNSQSKTIFVGNLNFSTTEDALRDYFEDCGGIKDVRVNTKPDGSSKGFAHIEFNDERAAQKALKRNDEKLEGRRLKVDLAQGRKNQ